MRASPTSSASPERRERVAEPLERDPQRVARAVLDRRLGVEHRPVHEQREVGVGRRPALERRRAHGGGERGDRGADVRGDPRLGGQPVVQRVDRRSGRGGLREIEHVCRRHDVSVRHDDDRGAACHHPALDHADRGGPMAIRTASAEWKGDLPSGTGTLQRRLRRS